MIIMSFAIRNKAALRTFSNANLSGNLYGATRSLGIEDINKIL